MEEVQHLHQHQGHHQAHHQAHTRILAVVQTRIPALARATLQKDACTSTRKTAARVVSRRMAATPRQSCHLDVQRDQGLRQDLPHRHQVHQRHLHHTMILVVVQTHDLARAKRPQQKDVCTSTRKTRLRVASPHMAATPRQSFLKDALTTPVSLWSRCHDLQVNFVSGHCFPQCYIALEALH